MCRVKRFSSVGTCTSLFAVVLLTLLDAACDGKGPINSNKEGGLASAPQVKPSSNLNASANTSAKEAIFPPFSVIVKGKVVSVDTSTSEVVGSVAQSPKWIEYGNEGFVGRLFCSGKFIFGAKEVEEGDYWMFLRHPSPRVWHLLLFRPGTERRVDSSIAMMALDEKPTGKDQRKPVVELEGLENYAVITIRLANVELKGNLIIV